MSRAELRTYVTAHRDDDEAWDAFLKSLNREDLMLSGIQRL